MKSSTSLRADEAGRPVHTEQDREQQPGTGEPVGRVGFVTSANNGNHKPHQQQHGRQPYPLRYGHLRGWNKHDGANKGAVDCANHKHPEVSGLSHGEHATWGAG